MEDNRVNAGDADQRNPKSVTSTRHSFLRFLNTTDRRVDIIWINYDGVRVKYKTIGPKEHFDVTSFVSHPWIFRDADNHSKLVCSSREVYFCQEPKYVRVSVDNRPRPSRLLVSITLPLYSLYEAAMQKVQQLLRKPEDAYNLELPLSIQRELHELCKINMFTRHNNDNSNRSSNTKDS